MRLHEYSVLKYVAIFLFCGELLAPSLACAFQTNYNKNETEQIVLSTGHSVSINALFFEEEIEEERDGRNHSILTLHFFHRFHLNLELKQSISSGQPVNQQKYQTQPPLFKRHCSYAI